VEGGAELREFTDRLEMVLARIEGAARRVGRHPSEITVIASTKNVPVERLRTAWQAGCRHFGENRVQEALAKMEAFSDGREPAPEWHLIGPLQTNKVKAAVGQFALMHAVDRLEVAERLDAVACARGYVQPILLEVNVAEEATKHGFAPADLPSAAERVGELKGLRLLGLMAIPPAGNSPERARPHFRHVRRLAEQVEAKHISGVSMKELSMGMSEDFEAAIEEGATMVRIGTALFGPRQ